MCCTYHAVSCQLLTTEAEGVSVVHMEFVALGEGI
jgi:hypothetical protein